MNKENIWTLDAMKTSSDWHHLRMLARNTLPLFNRTETKPKLDWLTFVTGKKGGEEDHST